MKRKLVLVLCSVYIMNIGVIGIAENKNLNDENKLTMEEREEIENEYKEEIVTEEEETKEIEEEVKIKEESNIEEEVKNQEELKDKIEINSEKNQEDKIEIDSIKEKIVGRTIENRSNANELDDRNLNLTMEEFLKLKEAMPEKYAVESEEKKVKVENGVEIIESNLKWDGDLNLTNNPEMIVLHHIEASRPGSTIPVTDVHQWHLNNGWAGIGYHFYITKDGKIYRGRPENAIGAHAQGKNINTIGIAVEGKYQTENMPEIQKQSVIKLGQYLRQKYKIQEVKGHGEVTPTDCPGKKYPLNSIKNEILSYVIKDEIIENKKPLKEQNFSIRYAAQGEDYGWQQFVKDGAVAGTTGQHRRMEGIKIELDNTPQDLGISYRTHSEGDAGWRAWKNEGEIAGTVGESKRLEAIEIKLTGKMAKNYSIEYRAHCEDYGWKDWVKDGEMAGTMGESKRVEAIEIRVVKKEGVFGVDYAGQGEDYGWQKYVNDGQLAGTTGQHRRLEGIKLKLRNAPAGVGIRYKDHVEGEAGFSQWRKENELAGTVGESKRLEAIIIELTGENKENYDIEYRAHVEDHGWQKWMKNGDVSGTVGEGKRIEGIEVRIVEK